MSEKRSERNAKPLIVITGAAGQIGTLVKALKRNYRIAGLDLKKDGAACPVVETDLSSPDSVVAVGDDVDLGVGQLAEGDRLFRAGRIGQGNGVWINACPQIAKSVDGSGTRRGTLLL